MDTPSPRALPAWAMLLLLGGAGAAGLLVPWLTGKGEMQGRLVRLYGIAAGVLILAVAFLAFGRKWIAPAASPGKDLAVLGGTTVGSRARVVLVRAKGQRLLAGLDAGGIKILLPLRG